MISDVIQEILNNLRNDYSEALGEYTYSPEGSRITDVLWGECVALRLAIEMVEEVKMGVLTTNEESI